MSAVYNNLGNIRIQSADTIITAVVMVLNTDLMYYAIVDGPSGCRILSARNRVSNRVVGKDGWTGLGTVRPVTAYLEAMMSTKVKEGWHKLWTIGDDVDYMPVNRSNAPLWWLAVITRFPEYQDAVKAGTSGANPSHKVFKEEDGRDYISEAPAVHRRRNKERKDKEYAERTIAHYGRFVKVKTAR